VEAIQRRLAHGAIVKIYDLDEQGAKDVHYLLSTYIQTLEENHQPDAVQHLYTLLERPHDHFVMIK
ncbi:MAG: hypothetical protein CUN55_18080, partial [Phototrophicales bacterium]